MLRSGVGDLNVWLGAEAGLWLLIVEQFEPLVRVGWRSFCCVRPAGLIDNISKFVRAMQHYQQKVVIQRACGDCLIEIAALGHEGTELKQPLGKEQPKCLFTAERIANAFAGGGLA